MRGSTYAVVIITRDRPGYLKQFIKVLDPAIRANRDIKCNGVAVIDDSVDPKARACNAHSLQIFMRSVPAHWIDRNMQEKLAREAGLWGIRGLARPLGSRPWCVGAARNTGALYWLTSEQCPHMIVFFDDDLMTKLPFRLIYQRVGPRTAQQ